MYKTYNPSDIYKLNISLYRWVHIDPYSPPCNCWAGFWFQRHSKNTEMWLLLWQLWTTGKLSWLWPLNTGSLANQRKRCSLHAVGLANHSRVLYHALQRGLFVIDWGNLSLPAKTWGPMIWCTSKIIRQSQVGQRKSRFVNVGLFPKGPSNNLYGYGWLGGFTEMSCSDFQWGKKSVYTQKCYFFYYINKLLFY